MNSNDIKCSYGFDVVGIVKGPAENIIILGLETRPDRDLDEFLGGKHPKFPGFKKHFIPRVRKLKRDIQAKRFKACQVDGYDRRYPLKQYAVIAGIGQQGKNTLIIHPLFDARLRFVALVTDMPLESSGSHRYECQPNLRCEKCNNLCVEECCDKALGEYLLRDETKCLARRQLDECRSNQTRCNLCWKACERSKA